MRMFGISIDNGCQVINWSIGKYSQEDSIGYVTMSASRVCGVCALESFGYV